MREMRQSGIEWMGDIPKEWSVMKIKHYCQSIFAGGTPQSNNADYWDGDIPWIPSGSCKNGIILSAPKYITKMGLDNSSTKLIPSNTTVMAMTGATCSNVGFVALDTCMNQSVVAYIEKKDKAQSKFLFYLLQGAQKEILTHKTGGAQSGINVDDCRNIVVPYIPLSEQQKIADFLDKKCGEIDELIALQEKMIEELKAYKQSVITEAVTKGLNPNVPMKDSGIEWIGDIPEHWGISFTKKLFDIVAGATPKTDNNELWDGDIPWITPADYKTEDKYVSKGRRNLTKKGMESCATYLLPTNCIVFSKRAPIGLVIITSNELCTNQGCLGCIPHNNVDACFFYYTMSVFTEQYELLGTGTTFKEISATKFGTFPLTLPSLNEQLSIASYLDTKCSEIDSLITIKRAKIEELKEYKKSIIYEYVTGKKEI